MIILYSYGFKIGKIRLICLATLRIPSQFWSKFFAMKQLLLIMAYIFPTIIFAQSIEPEVLATNGTSYENGVAQLSWTLGEMAVATWDNGTTMLTEGFHQAEILIISAEANPSENEVRVFPVPTKANLTVEIPTGMVNSVIHVMDMEGRQVYTETLNEPHNNLVLDGLSQGVYLLQLRYQDNSINYKIQIIK